MNDSLLFFGPFELRPAERLLEKAGARVHLSDRAFDILVVLVERSGHAVSKRELIARVWSDVTVDEGSLRFHISALRKALKDGKEGRRYIATLSGRGYCFVSSVSHVRAPKSTTITVPIFVQPHRLPMRLARMVGRDAAIEKIATKLVASRFVTIVGPGGIGKTAVVVSVSHSLLADFEGATCFFDLAMLNDPNLLPSAIASALGLIIQSDDPVPELLSFFRDKRMLLILDSCEHVIDTVAKLAERIVQEAPRLHLLATSREALRVEGEQVFQLPPLENPPDDCRLSAAEVLNFPAPQLFVERIVAGGRLSKLGDADAKLVGEMCRRLDGLPLAIELTASRVNALGIQETAVLLHDRLRLHWKGRRTAVGRHQTLSATLDWSHDLLTERERSVLRRLAVFMGVFPLEAARLVAAGDGVEEEDVAMAVEGLVAKSLLTTDQAARLRLLDSTKAYSLQKLIESGESNTVARRHAAYFLEMLQRSRDVHSANEGLVGCRPYIGNIRIALEWSFSEHGDLQLGTALAAAAAPLFLEMSFLTECSRWAAHAIAMLDAPARGTLQEIELQGSLGLSLMFAGSDSDRARSAFARGLEVAEHRRDLPNRLKMLARLHLFDYRAGHFRSALEFARRSAIVAQELADPTGIAFAHSLLGLSLHHDEDPLAARTHLMAALVETPGSRTMDAFQFGLDFRTRAGTCLARTLWLLGYSDQATRIAKITVEDAASAGHPITFCIALTWALSVFLWSGDWTSAEEGIDRLIAQAVSRSLGQYHAAGLGLKGCLLIMRGNAETAIQLLLDSIADMRAHRYGLLIALFNSTLAEGLLRVGRFADALATIDDTISLVEENGDLFHLPELLRIKGVILASEPQSMLEAENHFRQSLKLAARYSVLAWELRTATALAHLLTSQSRFEEAQGVLAPILARFTEGHESIDYKAAKGILDELTKMLNSQPS